MLTGPLRMQAIGKLMGSAQAVEVSAPMEPAVLSSVLAQSYPPPRPAESLKGSRPLLQIINPFRGRLSIPGVDGTINDDGVREAGLDATGVADSVRSVSPATPQEPNAS